jgi:hypothetical protein
MKLMSNSEDLIQELLSAFSHLQNSISKKPLYIKPGSEPTPPKTQHLLEVPNAKSKDVSSDSKTAPRKRSDNITSPYFPASKNEIPKSAALSFLHKNTHTTPEINFSNSKRNSLSINVISNEPREFINKKGERALSITFQKMDSNLTNNKKSIAESEVLAENKNFLVIIAHQVYNFLECE